MLATTAFFKPPARLTRPRLPRRVVVRAELLASTGNVPWFKAGAEIFSDSGIQYLGIPGLVNAKSIIATLIVQVGAARHRHRRPAVLPHKSWPPAVAGMPCRSVAGHCCFRSLGGETMGLMVGGVGRGASHAGLCSRFRVPAAPRRRWC